VRPDAIISLACVTLAVATGILRRPHVDEDLETRLPARVTDRGFTTSGACQACHPAQYDSWHRSFHRTMTQVAAPSSVLGSFDGVVLESRGFQWRLERRADQFWVQMPDPVWFEQPAWLMRALDETWPEQPPLIDARVVMTTGSHHMQNYWVRRPDREGASLGPDDGSLIEVPWVWLIDEARWVPNLDSFLTPPSGSVGGVARWNANCSQCHSVGTEPGTSASYERFDTRTVELGIACEACHGPGERHAAHYRSPVQRYLRYFLTARGDDAADPTIVNPAKLDARRSAQVCGQCHSFGEWLDQAAYRQDGIRFAPGQELHEQRRVFRYEPGPAGAPLAGAGSDTLSVEGRFWRDGTSRVAGREYNALLASTHFTEHELTCLSCHSLHGYADRDSQLAPGAAGDQACLGCHEELADEIAEHSRHRPASSGAECMNCHMPRTTYGLFSAMRSHRIDSPSVQVTVESGRPNACNLCHLDQTLEWTGRYLAEWYGQPLADLDPDHRAIAAAALWTLKGDAAQRTIVAWHMGWGPAREASGDDWMAPYLAQLLTDPYSATRRVAYRSIVVLPGFGDFRYDYVAPPAVAGAKADEAMGRWMRAGGAPEGGPRLLIGADGSIALDQWLALLAERDHRPLTIRE
jgi:hypothetical protein